MTWLEWFSVITIAVVVIVVPLMESYYKINVRKSLEEHKKLNAWKLEIEIEPR